MSAHERARQRIPAYVPRDSAANTLRRSVYLRIWNTFAHHGAPDAARMKETQQMWDRYRTLLEERGVTELYHMSAVVVQHLKRAKQGEEARQPMPVGGESAFVTEAELLENRLLVLEGLCLLYAVTASCPSWDELLR